MWKENILSNDTMQLPKPGIEPNPSDPVFADPLVRLPGYHYLFLHHGFV